MAGGDWSPLLRRRLVAVNLPCASAHACGPALARAVSAPLGHPCLPQFDGDQSPWESGGQSCSLYGSPHLHRDRRAGRRRASSHSARPSRHRFGHARFRIGPPSATLCVASHLCGVRIRLRPAADGRLPGRRRRTPQRWDETQSSRGLLGTAAANAARRGFRPPSSARPRSSIRIKSRTSHRTPQGALHRWRGRPRWVWRCRFGIERRFLVPYHRNPARFAQENGSRPPRDVARLSKVECRAPELDFGKSSYVWFRLRRIRVNETRAGKVRARRKMAGGGGGAQSLGIVRDRW